MAQINLTIPDTAINRILDGFANEYGWTSDLGVTKAQFAKARIIDFIKHVVKTNEGRTQSQAIQNTINAELEAVNIT